MWPARRDGLLCDCAAVDVEGRGDEGSRERMITDQNLQLQVGLSGVADTCNLKIKLLAT